METRGAAEIERLRQELPCPECGYDLRGLAGTVVTCPECGHRSDVARLIVEKWTRPWHAAPGFTRMLLPVAWLLVVLVVAPLVFVVAEIGGGEGVAMMVAMAGVAGAGWLVLLWSLRSRMPGGLAVRLSILAHVLAVGYMGGVVVLGNAVIRLSTDRSFTAVALSVVLGAIAVVVLVASRRGERYIAGRCIRQYLLDRARVAGEDPAREPVADDPDTIPP